VVGSTNESDPADRRSGRVRTPGPCIGRKATPLMFGDVLLIVVGQSAGLAVTDQ